MIMQDKKILRLISSKTSVDECKQFDIFNRLENNISDGLGLSAIQIGLPVRACIIKNEGKFIRMINTIIIKKYDPIKVQGEGCLSFPGEYRDTWRYKYCVVEWTDETGYRRQTLFNKAEAVTIQHEIDHFNGILFFDRQI